MTALAGAITVICPPGGRQRFRGGHVSAPGLRTQISLARTVGRAVTAAWSGRDERAGAACCCASRPDAIRDLATRLTDGSAVIRATNGKTTTSAMLAEILERLRLAYNRSGANLSPGDHLDAAGPPARGGTRELGLFEVDEAALPEVADRLQPRLIALGNLFRDQLDRYGELELVAVRWRALRRRASGRTARAQRRRPAARDPAREPAVVLLRPRRPGHGAASPTPPIRRTAPLRRAAASTKPSMSDTSVTTTAQLRPPPAAARRSAHARSNSTAWKEAGSRCAPRPARPRRARAARALQRLQRDRGGGRRPRARNAARPDRLRTRPCPRRLRPLRADRGRPTRRLLMLLIKNPAGANEVVRDAPRWRRAARVLVALNDDIADGRDVSWIWDVDFEPLLAVEAASSAAAHARPNSRSACYAGFPRERIEVIVELERALDRGLELTPAGGELVSLPTYTAMLELRGVAARGEVEQRVVTGLGAGATRREPVRWHDLECGRLTERPAVWRRSPRKRRGGPSSTSGLAPGARAALAGAGSPVTAVDLDPELLSRRSSTRGAVARCAPSRPTSHLGPPRTLAARADPDADNPAARRARAAADSYARGAGSSRAGGLLGRRRSSTPLRPSTGLTATVRRPRRELEGDVFIHRHGGSLEADAAWISNASAGSAVPARRPPTRARPSACTSAAAERLPRGRGRRGLEPVGADQVHPRPTNSRERGVVCWVPLAEDGAAGLRAVPRSDEHLRRPRQPADSRAALSLARDRLRAGAKEAGEPLDARAARHLLHRRRAGPRPAPVRGGPARQQARGTARGRRPRSRHARRLRRLSAPRPLVRTRRRADRGRRAARRRDGPRATARG